MNYWDKRVVRQQLDKRLKSLKDYASLDMPQQGWIKTFREALGLSSSQLGKKQVLISHVFHDWKIQKVSGI
jgi:hypothetical protein